MDRHDYILRLIEHLSRALGALRHRLLGQTVETAAAPPKTPATEA